MFVVLFSQKYYKLKISPSVLHEVYKYTIPITLDPRLMTLHRPNVPPVLLPVRPEKPKPLCFCVFHVCSFSCVNLYRITVTSTGA